MRPLGISALCRKHGVSRDTFYHRRKKGWTVDEALLLVERRGDWVTQDQQEINRVLKEWKR